MKLSMLADFKILKRNENGEFLPMDKTHAQSVSIGGFNFRVGENSIPFDWDAFTGHEEDRVFSFSTGRGFAFNDFELGDYYDDQYKDMNLKREDISAEFLASANHIEEFFVNFEDGDKICGVGSYDDNAKDDVNYKLELIEISFEDMETSKYYDVKPEVILAFNKGVKLELKKDSLDEKIKSAESRSSVQEERGSSPELDR